VPSTLPPRSPESEQIRGAHSETRVEHVEQRGYNDGSTDCIITGPQDDQSDDRALDRDLALLRDLGIPVDSDRGRGGGMRMEQGWSLGRVHLSESEAIGMLLSLTIAEKVGSPLMLDDARMIARKIARSFTPAQARRILAIRRRILVGAQASDQVLSSYVAPAGAVTQPVHAACMAWRRDEPEPGKQLELAVDRHLPHAGRLDPLASGVVVLAARGAR
jgi:hypothetical protein